MNADIEHCYIIKCSSLYIQKLNICCMIQKNINQVLLIKTDLKIANDKIEFNTALTDKVAIEKKVREIFITRLGLEVVANYIQEDKLIIVNGIGV